MRHTRLPLLLSGALLVGAVAVAPAAEVPAGATTSLNVAPFPLVAGIKYAQLKVLSCTKIGTCVAGGLATKGPVVRAALSSETGGTWSPFQVVGPNVSSGATAISGVACPAKGACVAVGDYLGSFSATGLPRSSGFLVTQQGSGWSAPQTVPLLGNEPHSRYGVVSLQCPAANDCVVVGLDDLTDVAQEGFAETWSNGTWGTPHFFSPSDVGGGHGILRFTSLSCPSTSSCTEVGQYLPAKGRATPFTVVMSNGAWGHLSLRNGYHQSTNANSLSFVSCVAAGTCVATGNSTFSSGTASLPLIMSESKGAWSPPTTIVIPGVTTSPKLYYPLVPVISCVTASRCTAVITSRAADGLVVGVATLAANAKWRVTRITDLGPYKNPTLLALSCFESGCVGVGTGTEASGTIVPVVVTTHGSW